MEKLNVLVEKIKEIGESYLMFSGGLDSCAILGAATKANVKVIPVWINNGFGRAEVNDIKQQVKNISHQELHVIVVKPTRKVASNPSDRCYYCKHQIIEGIQVFGADSIIMDGTTGSDTGYRPGRKALTEHGVVSPLADLDISSDEAKEMALSMGADKTIADLESCMATRVNYNVLLDEKNINILTEMERLIIGKTHDFNVRCRLDDADHIRIELSEQNSFSAFHDEEFRNSVLALGEELALFTTIDLKPSRPNAYDNRIKNDF